MARSTFKSSICVVILCFLQLVQFGTCQDFRPIWSVCGNSGSAMTCRTGLASDDCSFYDIDSKYVNVKGLFVFFVTGRDGNPGETGLAEFVFRHRFEESYYSLSEETAGKITCLKQMGDYFDYRTPALTLVNQLSLISDGAVRFTETQGSVGSCTQIFPVKSLAINGAERWELIGRDGASVCIQVEDTLSFVPGIVRDTRTLGFDHEMNNICAVIRGCSKLPEEVIRIPNNETSGVLRR